MAPAFCRLNLLGSFVFVQLEVQDISQFSISAILKFANILPQTDTGWGELSATSNITLQCLQNRAARIVLRRDSSKDTLNVLGWTELETKRKRHKCVLVYKCHNNLVPQYLSYYITGNYTPFAVHLQKISIHLC